MVPGRCSEDNKQKRKNKKAIGGKVGKVGIRAKWPAIGPAHNSGFCSLKRLGVFLLLPGRNTSPWQGCPQH